jgi:hypothetical protein
MAQAGFTPISLYFSSTAAAVPTSGNLANGELALNIADMKLYAKNSAGTVTLLASNAGASGSVTSVSGTGTVNGLTLTGTVTTSGSLTLGGTLSGVNLTSQVTGTLPTANGGTNLTSFTSGGVVYASSTSALATGSGLTFDGTGNLTCTGTVTGNSFTAYSNSADGGTQGYVGNAKALFGGSPPTSSLGVRGETNILFGISSTESMRLNSTGLGIGTTNVTGKLTIDAPDTLVLPTLSMRNGGGSYGFDFDSETVSTGRLDLYRINLSVRTQVMTWLRGSGHIGIGTNSPSYTVDIKTDANNALRVGSSANAFGTLLQWNNASGYSRVTSIGGYPLDLGTNETTRFRIGDAGQFGIGGATYGTAGQVLTSGGSGAAPTWAAAGGGSQAFVAFGSTGGL